jgi:hypothetical protein
MSKATHTGHCQVCGAEQKLPNSNLSTHGYTVQWGFFNGICTGTKHLPFEQDISLVQGAIDHALEIKAGIEAQIVKYTNSTETSAWFHNYKVIDPRRGRKGYVWEYLPVIFETRHYPAEGSLKEFWAHDYGHAGETVQSQRIGAGITYTAEFPMAASVEERNGHYRFGVLEPQLKQITRYIKWQQDRIRNWKPSELKPIQQEAI